MKERENKLIADFMDMKYSGKRDSKGNAHRFSICMCDASIEGTEIAVIGARSKEDAIYEACIQFITRQNMIEILNN